MIQPAEPVDFASFQATVRAFAKVLCTLASAVFWPFGGSRLRLAGIGAEYWMLLQPRLLAGRRGLWSSGEVFDQLSRKYTLKHTCFDA